MIHDMQEPSIEEALATIIALRAEVRRMRDQQRSDTHIMDELTERAGRAEMDTARLDALEQVVEKKGWHYGWVVQAGHEEANFGLVRTPDDKHKTVRAAIDAARK